MKGQSIEYSAEELAWIEAHREWPRAKAHAAFRDCFGREDVSAANYTALCKRKGWMTGRSGQFSKGQDPHNKGKPMPFNENSARTRFKKGNRTGRANERYKPIGSERLSKDGYWERKVHDGNPIQSRWQGVHLIRWEEVNGTLPEGHCLKCLDGDRTNTDPCNWTAIPRALLPRLSGRWNVPYDTAPAELKPAILTTAKLAHAVRERRKLA